MLPRWQYLLWQPEQAKIISHLFEILHLQSLIIQFILMSFKGKKSHCFYI